MSAHLGHSKALTDRNYDLCARVQFHLAGAHEGQLDPVFGSLKPVVAEASSFTTYTVLIPEPNCAALFFLGAAGLTCCRQRAGLYRPSYRQIRDPMHYRHQCSTHAVKQIDIVTLAIPIDGRVTRHQETGQG